ncbi:MAG: endonuclease MutS2 [Lachnospiraceae bacterium]|nr:endonuclease MutS2 [Lachnospiraceae bacterium]
MNKKALTTLEYNKIILKLEDFAASAPGKEMCRALLPSSDIEIVRQTQKETADALLRIIKKGSLSFAGIKNIGPSLKRLAIGSSLGMGELLAIASLLEATARVKAFSSKLSEEDPEDSLDERFSLLNPIPTLMHDIQRCIVSDEEMSDEASPALKSIRRSIQAANAKIRSQLNAFVADNETRTFLQENVVTMRNGRFCIPVKQEYRGQVPGMIHDQSSSGSTLFVEPMAIVKLNNDLKELAIKEQEEIERILAVLSNEAAEYIEQLQDNLTTLTELDFIFAKAAFARTYKGSMPIYNTNGIIDLKDARHPLIDPKKVVPSNIWLGKDFDLLIVTGPNTGGKTVSLKTVGLLSLMGQAGLHIPAYDGSKLALFNEIYADIGDEQSIEQSLSTFSSHMTNIVSILENVDSNSLVLFDELGSGTDPVEGAALAMSVLSFLHNMQVRTMATTHYSELKLFALSTEGVENACCEFNVETLQPTYRLLIGIPGKSNAFAISKKLGLPEFIIEDAKNRITEQNISFEDLLADLESSRITIEKERAETEAYKAEITQLRARLQQKEERIDERRDNIIRKANEEAQEILREAKAFADESIRKFNKGLSGKDMEAERSNIRGKLEAVDNKLALKKEAPKNSKEVKPSDLHLGDEIMVLSMGLKGTVTTLPNAKGDFTVQMGILKSQVNIKGVALIAEAPAGKKQASRKTSVTGKFSKSSTISAEINLIGKTTDEAIAALDKYLDDAYLSHLSQVRVVHGKGTGALRQAVHSHLKRLKYVASYRLGAFGEGDAGVTIVEFKQ